MATEPRSTLDEFYVRERGEYVHAALFPRPREDGVPVVPMPVLIDYEPFPDDHRSIAFVRADTFRNRDYLRPSSEAFDERGQAQPGWTLVMVLGHGQYWVDLTFGTEVSDVYGTLELGIVALLRAVTGT